MLQNALVEWQKAKVEEKKTEKKTMDADKKDVPEEADGEPLPEARRALNLLYDDVFECRTTKVSQPHALVHAPSKSIVDT